MADIFIKEEEEASIVVDGDMEKLFGGLFCCETKGGELVVSERPQWVKGPDGDKHYIHDMYVAKQNIYCPKCGAHDKHGLIITNDNLIILCCKGCKEFIWTKIKE